jgi:histidyl-tRNA synthetase
MIGPDERAGGNVLLRDLSTGEQRTVAHDQIETELVGLVGQPASPVRR